MEKRRANGTFLPGSTPWNKGVKGAQVAWNKGKRGYMGKNCTSFSAENLKRSDYKPRIVKDHSRTTMQITLRDTFVPYKDPYNGKTYMCHKRIPYARYVLEKAGYTVPKNYVVWHKDGNPLNNALENLAIISRAELIKINNPKSTK